MRKTGFSFLLILGCLCLMISGCTSRKIALDPPSQEFFETARLIMSNQEQKIFSHLPDAESRKEFINDFWAKRDPDPDTEENEFKEEFLRRIEYANQRFNEGTPGWKTDRGRIYIYLGPPDKVDELFSHEDPSVRGSIIFWVYYKYNFAIRFVDKSGMNQYTFDPYYGVYGNVFDAIERAKFGLVFQEESGKKFWDFDLSYDKNKKEFVVSLPATALTFIEQEGMLVADFEFQFEVYAKKDIKKEKFAETRHFEAKEEEVLHLKEATFRFARDLKPGKYYVDVTITAKPGDLGKSRKIFEIKV